MDFLHLPQQALFTVTAFIVALTVIVFIHEYGHYFVARLFKVKVEAFSIGFGSEIFGWYDKRGTRWKVCWLPLGGYVKFEGDANAASMPSAGNATSGTSFHAKPLAQRAAVVVAGPMANFLTAIVIIAGIHLFVPQKVVDPVAGEIVAGSAAEQAGLQKNDIIREVDGRKISTFNDLAMSVSDRIGEELILIVERGGSLITIAATPRSDVTKDIAGKSVPVGRLGIRPSDDPKFIREVHYTPITALQAGVTETWQMITTSLRFMGKLVTGNETPKKLSGIVGIADATAGAAGTGFLPYIFIIALISVSIGLVNLFPVPMLDGGHLVFYAIEAIRGRPLAQSTQEWGFRIGLTFVMMVFIMVTWNDLVQKFGG